MPGVRVSVSEIHAAGGFARWHERMTRAANAHPVKSPVLGGGGVENGQRIGSTPKNAATGQESGKTTVARGTPNLTERRYHETYLLPRILTGEIVGCEFEGKTFELARDCRYTPDWWVVLANGLTEVHEVKGKMVWEDSRIKVKWAAQRFPEVRFTWAQWKGGKWTIKQVPA
ncbi:hypothetical protein DFW101_3539 [Solidesulfovibrio carbinoliphilus subsp. oakridgensis]|uniref:DUF1064 domain-containing protein n=1 Tax=Solidesulfovibrio carbinoliphilus subsp. oakridgensis TaxID=694327 RepID=G7QC89_9BACT|nr:DUF1064 domain-containing protein [Solidesulfovibrio carbinoliphilus]EHJ49535.1 hypothetical protein DFW101_3539 [Solidesulfovibrio carbinoliphilus subsp. oakridgensis]